jgi:hypothetical protein
METLQEAYCMAKSNDGAPGIDGVTFEAIEESGRESVLKQIQGELVQHTYQPMRVRKKEIALRTEGGAATAPAWQGTPCRGKGVSLQMDPHRVSLLARWCGL